MRAKPPGSPVTANDAELGKAEGRGVDLVHEDG